MEKLCPKCNKMKYITAFEVKEKRVFFKHWYIDYSECMDCKYPHRWDEVREGLKKFMNK